MKLGDLMKKHIAQWFIFTVLFALIPLLIFLLSSAIFKNSIENIINKSFHELYFYSIMISASTIRDLLHVNNEIKETARFIIAFGFIIILLIASTAVYGMIIFIDNFIESNVATSISSTYINTLFTCSLILGLFTTIISLLVVFWRYSK